MIALEIVSSVDAVRDKNSAASFVEQAMFGEPRVR